MPLVLARGVLVALALIPFVVDAGVMFPFITPKVLALRVAVAVAAAVLTVQLALSGHERALIGARLAAVGRQPLAIAVGVLLLVTALTTITSVDLSRSYFGEVARGEGFATMLGLGTLFLLAAVLLEPGDWTWFFRLTVLVGAGTFVHAVLQWQAGDTRPSAFTGHPAHLGPLQFFVIAAAGVLAASSRNRVQRGAAVAGLAIGVATMLLTQTRAAFLGAAAGAFAVALFHLARGVARSRGVAAATIALVLAASIVFLATRSAPLWQSIPGVARIAAWTPGDGTTRYRVGVWKAGITALSPGQSGWWRVIVGWGPEEVHVPLNRHYDPDPAAYDPAWYDRSHNELLDVALMSGVLGLISYLALFAAMGHAALHRAMPPPAGAALLFVGVAIFVQNLVSFESLVLQVPFVMMLAWAASLRSASGRAVTPVSGAGALVLVAAAAISAAAILGTHTIGPYVQMRLYVSLYDGRHHARGALAVWNRVTRSYSYAQPAIRMEFVPNARILVRRDQANTPLLQAAVTSLGEVAQRDSLDPRVLLTLAEATGELADLTGQPALHQVAEQHLVRAAALAPGRRHVRTALAIARKRQACAAHMNICYYAMLRDLVGHRDVDGIGLVRERLELLDPARRPLLAAMGGLVAAHRFEAIRVTLDGNNVTIALAPDG